MREAHEHFRDIEMPLNFTVKDFYDWRWKDEALPQLWPIWEIVNSFEWETGSQDVQKELKEKTWREIFLFNNQRLSIIEGPKKEKKPSLEKSKLG